jgi:hypothetical protein
MSAGLWFARKDQEAALPVRRGGWRLVQKKLSLLVMKTRYWAGVPGSKGPVEQDFGPAGFRPPSDTWRCRKPAASGTHSELSR